MKTPLVHRYIETRRAAEDLASDLSEEDQVSRLRDKVQLQPMTVDVGSGAVVGVDYAGLVAVIPALNEEGSIGGVVASLKRSGVVSVIVADNGSTDRTSELAIAAGAHVVKAVRRGYGSACLAGIAALPPDALAVVFCDGDGADDLSLLANVVEPVLSGEADLVIGSRALGSAEAGALTLPQRAGNWVAATLLRALFSERVSDLGPFRCISTTALWRLAMRDPAFGWTAEMQTKALRLNLRVVEVPVNARARRAGESKISGRTIPVLRAGWAILTTIVRYRFARLPSSSAATPEEVDVVASSNAGLQSGVGRCGCR